MIGGWSQEYQRFVRSPQDQSDLLDVAEGY